MLWPPGGESHIAQAPRSLLPLEYGLVTTLLLATSATATTPGGERDRVVALEEEAP